MSQKKPKIYKILSKLAFLAICLLCLVTFQRADIAQAAHATECSDVFTTFSSSFNSKIESNKPAYIGVMNETGVPWEMLAAIHYRETNFGRSNPSNGQGIFQFVNGDGGPYPPGPVSDEEFYRQLKFMANKLQDDYVWRGSVPRERRRLQASEQNIVLVKDTLFSYNGRAGAYATQAEHFGYNRTTQPYEGSPYVMNRFDCKRARMGIITSDGGAMNSTDTRYGTFTVFARLRGDSYWRSLFSDYAWYFEGNINISTGSSVVRGNEPATITLKARNIGNQSWSNTNFPVRLGTYAPTNHNSALYHPSWQGPFRPATLKESVVQPGELGTFEFVINVPNRSGIYDERFNLVAEGSTWFNDAGFMLHLIIDKSNYYWEMKSQSSSTNSFVLLPSSTAQFTLVAKNTGNRTWSNTTNPVRLGTWNPTNRQSPFYDSSWTLPIRPAVLQESSVAPGANGTFVFIARAPAQEGFYVERYNLVMEGVEWFTDPWMEFDITVDQDLSWQMVPGSQTSSTESFTIPRNTNAQFTLEARNTGNMTWTNSSNPVRLATWNPSYRTSVFNDGSWVNAFRAATLAESSVPPDGIGTFVFNIRTPNTPGLYVERFNLVMEGVAWFVDPWVEFDIQVTN